MLEFLIGLLIVFIPILAGIVFLVLFLVYRSKAAKSTRKFERTKRFLIRLRAEKRISDNEYEAAIGQRSWESQGEWDDRHPAPPLISPQVTRSQPAQAQTEQVKSAYPFEARADQQTPVLAVAPAAEKTAPQHNPAQIQQSEKKPFNAMNVLLVVGVIFIVLAGAVFATTTWLYLHPIVRLLIICSTSLVFFAASALAEKALNIPKTAMSFFTIASIFLPISVIGVGFFELLGDYFSLDGDGKYFVFLAASAVLAVACRFGTAKYKLFFFAEAFLYCVTASYVFLIASFHPEKSVFILLLYVYAALLIVAGNVILGRKKKQQNLSYIARRVPTFSVINAITVAVIGSFVSGFGLTAGIPAILIAPFFLTDLFRGKNSYAGTIPFAVMMTLGLLRINTGDEYIHFILLAVLAVAIVAGVGTLRVFPEKMRKWFSVSVVAISAVVYVFQFGAIVVHDEWTLLQLMALLGLFATLVFLAYRNKERRVLFFLPIIAVTVVTGATSLLDAHGMDPAAMLSLISALFFFGFAAADKKLSFSPRTAFSDILFPVWCVFAVMISIVGLMRGHEFPATELVLSLVPFLLLAIVLVFLSLEKNKRVSSSFAASLLPYVLFLTGLPFHRFCDQYFNGAWILLLTFFALACTSLLAYKYRNRFRTMNALGVSGFAAMIVAGLGLAIYFVAEEDMLFVPGLAWIFAAFLVFRIAWMSTEKSFSKSAPAFFAHSVLAGAVFYMALILTANQWIKIDSFFITILFPAAAALIFSALAPVLRFFGKDVPGAFHHMDRIGSYGLTLFSALMTVAFIGEDEGGLVFPVVFFLAASVLFRYIQGRAYYATWFEMGTLYVAGAAFVDKFYHFETEWIGIIVFSVLFVISAGSGRFLHRVVFDVKNVSAEHGGKRIDWLSLTSVLSPLALLFLGPYARWVACTLFALYALNFLRRTRVPIGDRIAETAAAFFVVLAFWSQPLFDIPGIIVLEYDLLVFIAYFIFIHRWVFDNRVTKLLLFLSACVSFAIMGIAAIISADIVDALILGIAAFAVLVVSFFLKKKRWFILATVTVLVLALYMTREFWAILDWWVYLLIVGLILIGMAAANEISKKKGEKLSAKARRLFKDWD